MRALVVVKQKRRYYADLLRICHKRIFDDKIKEFERIARTSLVISMPHQLNKIQNLYSSDFLKEFERIKEISSIPVKNAKLLLEEEYGLFLEGHTSSVFSVAITSDNKYIVSGGSDNTVRIWNLQNRKQKAVFTNFDDVARPKLKYPEIEKCFLNLIRQK